MVEMRFCLLGPLQVLGDTGQATAVPAAKQRVILAALLLNANKVVTVGQLGDALWGASMPPNGAAVVRTYVMRLRRLLGENGDRISGQPPGYRLQVRSAAEFDLAEADSLRADALSAAEAGQWDRASELLRRALGLWRGTPLIDVPSDALHLSELPRLAEFRLELIESRVAADLQLGRSGAITAELRALVAEHPLRERFAAQLMLACYRGGRQAEALQAYQEVRWILVRELGIEPGPELRQMQRRILASDPELLAVRQRREAHAEEPPTAIRAPDLSPRQLPAAARHFTGRVAEREELMGLLPQLPSTGGAMLTVSIDGMAGAGKTALAVDFAHRVTDHFPGGQLFIDLHGYTRGHEPRRPDDALSWCLRALNVPPRQIPDDTEERAALYRHRLAGTRTLVVLDNAASEAQVRPLLPGTAGCLVLITSRRRLRGLADAHPLSLSVLAPADAAELLRTVAGLERVPPGDPVLAETAELCGRLPLALRIAAALLRHRSGWPLEYLAGQLRDRRQRLSALSDGETGLDDVFDLSYHGLNQAQRDLFRRLGLIPGPDTDAYAAAAVSGTDPGRAARLLEDLTDHNLLIQHVPGRYQLHDLLRLHAAGLAGRDPSSERDAAAGRLRDYYQAVAGYAEALIAPYSVLGPPGENAAERCPALTDHDAALAWLRAERANMLACLRDVTLAGEDARVVALTHGAATGLRIDGPWDEAVTLHAGAMAAAGRVGDRRGQAAALTQLGAVRRLTGDLPGAGRDLRLALESFLDLGDRRGEAAARTELGTVEELSGEHASAARNLREALVSFRDLGDRRGQATALALLGEVLRMACDYSGAARDLEEALGLYRELADQEGQADALIRLGDLRRLTGDYAGSVRDQKAALDIFLARGDRPGQASALTWLGDARRLAGDYPEAARNLESALQLYRDLGSGQGRAMVLTLLGAVQRSVGDVPAATRSLTEALHLFREAEAKGNEVCALNHYAAVLAAAGDQSAARAHYDTALRLAREVRQPDEEAVALEGIGECALRSGDAAAGIAYLERALAVFRELSLAPDAERVMRRLADLDCR
jgi:DNA-binding SARP family transcriptional activator/Tfp pilus assembly protein PilF